jgi:MFS family permease
LKALPQGQWIGEPPTGLKIVVVFFVGIIGILIPGVQPIVLAALAAEHHITLTQMGHAATAELLAMGLGAALAGALLPPRRLIFIGVISSLVMALFNWFTPFVTGEAVTALRAVTGLTGGILIWITSCLIARSAMPDRWAAIYLAVQTLTQLLIGALMSSWAEPLWGARGDFSLLALASVAAAIVAFALPNSFVLLPRAAGASAGGVPPARGMAALVVAFLLMMFIVSIWVYYDPIAHEAGLSAKVSENAVLLSLGFQVLGGTTAAVLAGRLRWYPTLIACAAVDLAMVWLLGTHPSALLFYIDAAIFGFIWLFILPFQVPMLIEADPSRRAAVLNSGIGLLGGSIGPSVVAEIISPENTSGALWLAAGCLVLCLVIATVLRLVISRQTA